MNDKKFDWWCLFIMANSRLSVAIHILSLIASKPYEQITSDSIAESVNTNPVVIRRMCGLLKKGGILTSRAGISGATLLKSPADITLLNIYLAVQSKSEWFAIHDHPNHHCPIGSKIHPTLNNAFSTIQQSMEKELAQITLQDIMDEMDIYSKI